MWYTQWKENRSVELVHIECEEFKEAFFEKYFPRDKKYVKVVTNHKQDNMSVEEYSLKFTILSMYGPSLVSKPRD